MKRTILQLLLILSLLIPLPARAQAAQMLIPGGQVLGLELRNDTVTVATFCPDSPAQAAGLKPGDRILTIDGMAITNAQDVRAALERSSGTVEITAQQGGKTLSCKVRPQITGEGPRLGIYLRQGITGIGTVTYYDPDNRSFGTLGHGVSDASGQLLRLTGGSAYPAAIPSVRRGRSGEPGQLLGTLRSQKPLGQLTKNTAQGVFGSLNDPPKGQPIPIGQAHTGEATIRCTVSGDAPREYAVRVLRLYGTGRSSGRNMLLQITDPALLDATGGIVQGM